MDKFLLLHKNDDNSPVTVNISQIEQIYRSSHDNCTVIVFVNNDDDMPVNESVERIYNMIEKKTGCGCQDAVPAGGKSLLVEGK